MWGTKNHRNTDGLKTGFQWAKYMVQKISSAQSLKYFNKNLFCSQVIAIHFQTNFSSKRQRSPDGFASFFQIRSYFTATFLLSSTALQTFLCTSWRGRKQVKRSTTFLSSPSGFIPPTSQVHLSKKSTVSLLLLIFLVPTAFHIWPLHTAGFLRLKRNEGLTRVLSPTQRP